MADRFERDIWLYQGTVGRIFRAGEDVPPESEGWLEYQTPDENGDVVAELRAQLDALGVAYHHKAGEKKLTELLDAATAPEADQ